MIYATAKVVNGKVVLSDKKIVDTSAFTADCFMIQMNGAAACTTCENLNKPRKCGGMLLREKYGVPPPVVKKKSEPIICGAYKDKPKGDCHRCNKKSCTQRLDKYMKPSQEAL
jgi:hypothetical protein